MRIPLFCFVFALLGSSGAQLRQVAVVDLPGRPGFDSTAIADGKLIVTHAGADTAEIFDPDRRRLVAQVRGLDEPRGIAVDEKGGRVYIANAGNNTVTMLSTQDWQVQNNFNLPYSPDALLWVPQMGKLVVGDWHDQALTLLDPTSGGVQNLALDGTPADVAWDRSRRLLVVSIEDHNQVALISPELRVVSRYALAASQPTGLAVDVANRKIFVAVRWAVVVLDADTGRELSRVPMGAGADRLWLDDSTQTLYAATAGGAVTVIKNDGGRYVAQQELNTQVRGHTLAFDSVRKMIYVPGGSEGRSKLVILKFIDNHPGPKLQSAAIAR
jgi:DNA-binding beta-propeller fold protein YncE